VVNFIQRNSNKKKKENINKFIKLFDEKMMVLKPNMKIFELISFICCRFVRKIVFEIIRQKCGGKLEPMGGTITSDEVRKMGNTLIESYEKKLK
jgi:hypothetical protein